MIFLKNGVFGFLLFGLLNCSPKLVTLSFSGIYYLSDESTNDLVCLEGIGAAKKEDAVLENGIQSVFKNLLLNGIPDSPYRAPIINANSANNHQAYIDQLLCDGYSSYITEAWLITPPNRANKKSPYSARTRVLIDLNSLKRTLRSKGVIAKFGL